MYLKSLEILGFKSFPDKTLIRFGNDITAIVGPNGSGKSNISDAIVWVLGEQSSKTLRGSKMEDVIFGGTQKRPAVGFAEATLTLDNTDRALPYDADEVMITRRYYRSGDSEYYINRQSARLRDINELFMDTGLGREGYSNIGQGRIDEILSLKSADRREIFEEAAGISKYRHRKEETQRQLEKTQENLVRIGDIVSELERQLEPLKQQSEKAKKYLSLKQELQGVEVAVWLDSLEKLTAAAKKAEEDYTSAAFVLQQANEDLDKLYGESERLSGALRRRDEELENLRVQVSMLEGAGQQLDGQVAVLRGGLTNNEENLRRVAEELKGQTARSGGLTEQLEQAKRRVLTIQAELSQKGEALSQLRQELDGMSASAQGMTKQYLLLRGKDNELTAAIAGAEAESRSLETAIGESVQRESRLQEELNAGSHREAAAQKQLDGCQKALEKARQDVTAAENAVAGYDLRLTARESRRTEAERKARELNAELDGVQAKARVYRAMERGFENYQRSVRAVMQEAQRGGLKNIHGPVSRLLRTSERDTVAIEIALGGATQHIVTDSEQDAKAAMAFLKRTGAGRATFLPMSVVKGKRMEPAGLETERGYVGIASALVTAEERYLPIIEYLLGRTVVVEDIDAAIAMGKRSGHRFKIVTLDGQVLSPGGSMTGGSVNQEAGILSRANELEKLNAREAELLKAQQTLQAQLQEAQRAADQARFQSDTAKEQLRAAQDQVLRLTGEEKQSQVLLQALREAEAGARRELEDIQGKLGENRRRQTALRAEWERRQAELTENRQALAALEGSQTEAETAAARIQSEMTAVKTAQAALEAEAATAQSHIRDLEALRGAMEGDRESKTALMASIRQEMEAQQSQIEALLARKRQNEAQVEDARRQRDAAAAGRSETEAQRTRTDRQIQEKNKDIQNMERACALLENKKSGAAMEEKQIVDKLWDYYGLTPTTAAEKRGTIESVAAGNRRIGELRRKLSALGEPNLGAIEEYARVNERYTNFTTQRDDVLGAKRDLERIITGITKEMTAIFVTEFQKINQYFGQTFQEMFGGGKGQLILEDPAAPLECGIEIRVQPPGKQLKTITLLSGGEKAFVAIALYFAILKVRPTPFCMLDEIDAALDDRNVDRFCTYLRTLSQQTQFIVITHRRGTMEASDVLYGVTMQEQGVSKLLRLDLNQMEANLGIIE